MKIFHIDKIPLMGDTGYGAVWLARVIWDHEAAGSNPVTPIRGKTYLKPSRFLLVMSRFDLQAFLHNPKCLGICLRLKIGAKATSTAERRRDFGVEVLDQVLSFPLINMLSRQIFRYSLDDGFVLMMYQTGSHHLG